jgi:hypothetical protein
MSPMYGELARQTNNSFARLRYPFYLKLLELELVYEWGCTHVRVTPETYKDLYKLVF